LPSRKYYIIAKRVNQQGKIEMRETLKDKAKVLVTGVGGFIGSHLAEALIKKGYKVVGLLAPEEDSPWIKNIDAAFIYGDITDKNSLYKAVESIDGITCIYHLASLLGESTSEKIYQTNFEGTKNLVDVCLDLGTKLNRFLFASSVAAIGPAQNKEIFDEEARCKPVSDYGRSKLLAEQFLSSVKTRLPITIVRLPLVYGPRNFWGFFYLYQVVSKGIRIDIGQAETTVGFVTDIVNGIILASESHIAVGKTYHLGEDKAYSSNEVMNIIAKALEKKTVKLKVPFSLLNLTALLFELYAEITGTKSVFQRKAVTDYFKHRYWRVDVSKAKREFGFEAKVPFETGAKITADWYKKEGVI
jgi:nucleoside-diphosphate-sugar epimerase